jgi:hypothetical protein
MKLARERAGPDAAGRASAARGARPRKSTLTLPPRTLGAPARRAAAVGPSVPRPPPYVAATRARSRTSEVDRRDRHVLLERGRQSCRAVGADAVPCGGAAHPRLKAQVSAARFQAEARTKVAPTRTRGAKRCCQGERSPRRAVAQRLSLSPSPHIGRAYAASRGRGPKRPPTPQYPAATRARSRTSEVDRRDRHVLLERGRQSFRAVGADVVAYGGAAHPRFKAQVSAARFQAEARAREARTRTRGARRCWQGERGPSRAAAQKYSISLPPRTLGAPARRAAAVGPSVPQPPQSPAATRARSRTAKDDIRDRRVLLERGRQSCRAVGADAVACGGAAHPRPRAQVSATRFQAEARAREARTRTRVARRCWQGERSPRRATAQKHSHSPSPHIGRACAAGRGRGPKRPPTPPSVAATRAACAPPRSTAVTVVFFWSQAARAVAPASPISFPAAGQHTRDSKPSSASLDSKPKHAQGALARERAGPDAAGRVSAAQGARPCKGSLSLPPHTLGVPARRARAVGTSVPNPSILHGHPSTLAHIRG